MTLLKNAANSVRLGLEDFDSNDEARSLSAARNLHAGILLLYKEKLRRLSPKDSNEVLLKVDIRPIRNVNGDITFEGKGKKLLILNRSKIDLRLYKLKSIGLAWTL